MSSKCPGCGFYTLACQCNKDDNYCRRFPHEDGKPRYGCDRVISDCRCDDHKDHYTYGDPSPDGNCNYTGYSGNDNCSSGGNSDGGDD